MKSLILSLSLLVTSAVSAAPVTQGLPDGSYLGVFKGQRKGKVNMVVKGYAGCQGCFVAIFVVDPNDSLFGGKGTPEIVAYSGVPHTIPTTLTPSGNTSDQYDLTPIGINEHDGKLTIPIADPALSLTITKNAGNDDVKFSIVSANDVNPLGIQSGMLFEKERESKFDLSEPLTGHYKAWHNRDNFLDLGTVISNDKSDLARSAPMNWSGDIRTKSGHFILKEQLPNVYSFAKISTLASGDEESTVPAFLTFFLEKNGNKFAVLVNIHQSTDCRRYNLKDHDIPETVAAIQAQVNTSNAGGATAGMPGLGENLEYPGGPTSSVTAEEIKALQGWAIKAKLEIMRIRNKISGVVSDQEKKDILVAKISKLAGDLDLTKNSKDPSNADFNTKDLLVRQSLYTGLVLVRIIDYAREKRGPTAGEVSEQVDILNKALDIAEKKDYGMSDQAFIQALATDRTKYQVNDKLIDFGQELSTYIGDMSTRMRPLNLLASYGAIRWSLGVLTRKILDDINGRALLGNTVSYLVNELKDFPEMEVMAANQVDDATLAVKIQNLKKLYLEIKKEIKVAQDDAAANSSQK